MLAPRPDCTSVSRYQYVSCVNRSRQGICAELNSRIKCRHDLISSPSRPISRDLWLVRLVAG